MEDEGWANDVVPDIIEIIEREGETRGGALCMTLSTLLEEWTNWGRDDIERLLKIMAGRRLLSRIAGQTGEELRMHPDARKLHETFLQRQLALEEEEEASFIEEEVMAEQAMEGNIPRPARNIGPLQPIADPEPAEEPATRFVDTTPGPPQPPPGSRTADAISGETGGAYVEVPMKKSISNLKAMFGGSHARVPSPSDFSAASPVAADTGAGQKPGFRGGAKE